MNLKCYNNNHYEKSDQQEWRYVAKILVAELKGDKSFRKSILGNRLSSMAGSSREKELALEAAAEEQATADEPDTILMDELKTAETTNGDENKTTKEEAEEEQNEEAAAPPQGEENEEEGTNEEREEGEEENGETGEEKEEEKRPKEESEAGGTGGDEDEERSENEEKEAHHDPAMFETLNTETNTQRLFLENIDMEEANQLSEAELKSTVFNALKTIEKLHSDLM